MVSFTFTMRHHLIRLTSAPFTSSRLPCALCKLQRLETKQNAKFTYRSNSTYEPKFTKFWGNVGDPFCTFQRPCRLSMLMSCFIRRKPSKFQSFLPQFLGRDDPDFSTASCYRALLLAVWQILVELRLVIPSATQRSLAIKWNAEVTYRVFKAVCGESS